MKNINLIFLRSDIKANYPVLDKQKEEYLIEIKRKFNLSNEGETFFFIESGGTEEKFKAIYKKYKEPFNLIATNANNSLPASLEIASFLANLGLRYNLYHSLKEDIVDVLTNHKSSLKRSDFNLCNSKGIKINKRYGVVGKPSDWLISSDVNYIYAKDKFGIELVDISFDEFKKEIENAKEIIDPIVFKNKLNEKKDEKDLEVALKIFSALYSLIKKYDLAGLTVRCFDLLSTFKNTSCLALAILNSMGYVATCEGDIPALITMALIKEKFHQSSFQVNPSYINEKENYGYFAHCTIPLDMTISYTFDTHFESGLGIGIKGELNLAKVTILKIGNSLDRFEVFEGQILENLKYKNLCRTQLKIGFCGDIGELFDSPCGNHLIIFKGHHKDEILDLMSK